MKKFSSIDSSLADLPERVTDLEKKQYFGVDSPAADYPMASDTSRRYDALKGEMLALRLSKSTKFVVFK